MNKSGVACAGNATVIEAKDIVFNSRPYLKKSEAGKISRCVITGFLVNKQSQLNRGGTTGQARSSPLDERVIYLNF